MKQKILVPHNPAWNQQFQQEAEQIRRICGDVILEIHHIGSTSIPGMIAQPIIDILGVFSDFETFNTLEKRFVEEAYDWSNDPGEYPWTSRFVRKLHPNKNDSHVPDSIAHLHFYPQGSPNIKRLLSFREYLIKHPKEADLYARIKCHYAKYGDPLFYSMDKRPFVRKIERLVSPDEFEMAEKMLRVGIPAHEIITYVNLSMRQVLDLEELLCAEKDR